MKNYLLPIVNFYENIMQYGDGVYVCDINGKKYLDLNSGQFCSVLGNNNAELTNMLSNQSKLLLHSNSEIIGDEVLQAAENLNKISGTFDARSIFLNTGAEAVEFCLRYAKIVQKKSGIICFSNGYHGLTLGAQSITYSGIYAKPHINSIFPVMAPDTFADETIIERCIQQFADTAKNNCDKIAAALLEPILSVGGMIIPADIYFVQIRQICDKYGILLIFDECQTGFARTGEWFRYQQIKCLPDMVACAKAIGLGYPVSIAMFSSELADSADFSVTHYSSHQNDGFSAQIVNVGIEYITKHNLLCAVQGKGRYFLDKLTLLAQRCPAIINPRGAGLMLGADLNISDIDSYRQVYRKLAEDAMKSGLILQGTNGGKTLRFLPAYIITEEQIDFCISTLEDLLNAI